MSPAQAKHRVEPGPNQIAHRLMSDIRNPHRGQLADPVQLGQAGAIGPIGLDQIPRLHRISEGATTMHPARNRLASGATHTARADLLSFRHSVKWR